MFANAIERALVKSAPMWVKATSTAVVLVMVAVVTSACGAATASDAARVGQADLSIRTVLSQAAVIDDLTRATQAGAPDGAAVNRAQVAVWIEEQLTAAVAKELKVTVSAAQVDQFLVKVVRESGLTREQFAQQFAIQQGTWVVPEQLTTFTLTYLQQQAIKAKLLPRGGTTARSLALNKALAKASQSEGVYVSPRYGAWDAAQVRVVDAANDLSSPIDIKAPSVPDPSSGQR